jgi:hypothetical protein
MTSKAGDRICSWKTLIDPRDIITVGCNDIIKHVTQGGETDFIDFYTLAEFQNAEAQKLGFVLDATCDWRTAGAEDYASSFWVFDNMACFGYLPTPYKSAVFPIYRVYPFSRLGFFLAALPGSDTAYFRGTCILRGLSRQTYLEYFDDPFDEADDNDSSLVKLPD